MNISKSPHTTTKSQTHPLRRVLIAVAIILLLALGGFCIWRFWLAPTSETPPNDTPMVGEDESEADDTDDTTDQPLDTGGETTTPTEPDQKVPQYEADDPNTLTGLTGSIARKTIQGDTATIVAMIDQYLHSTGLCTLRLISRDTGEVIYTASEDATADVTTSICGTFTVSLAHIPAGTYQIQIELSGDDKTGLISDELEVK